MKNTNTILIAKHTVYALLLLLLYVLQTVPGLFVVFGAKPILVIPFAIALAMHEGEFAGGIYGAAAGLLCDMSGPMLYGFNGFLCCLFCIAAGLLVIYLMHCNLANALFFAFVALMIRGSLEYLFGYGMWGYENVWKIYVWRTLPVVALSLVAAVPVYWMVRRLHRAFARRLQGE